MSILTSAPNFENPSNIQQLRSTIDNCSNDKNSLSQQVRSIFQEKTEQLIGELMTDPQQNKNWREMGRRLKQVDPELFKNLQASIGSIQKIATLLKKDDIKGLDRFTSFLHEQRINQTATSVFPLSDVVATAHFHSLKLPDDINEVRAIAHPEVKAHVLANLINRDGVPLDKLNLSKGELAAIAPHLTFVECKDPETRAIIGPGLKNDVLIYFINRDRIPLKQLDLPQKTMIEIAPDLTYVDCKDCFEDWGYLAGHEVQDFLDRCLNAGVLKFNFKRLYQLPPVMGKCVELDCSHSGLMSLPTLPNCKTLNCSFCNFLMKITNPEQYQELDCQSCPNLTQNLRLPDDIAEIRAIARPEIRTQVFVNLINQNPGLSLSHLNLSKEELMTIAPHLKIVDCTDLFNDDWSDDEMYQFLDQCSNAEALKVNSSRITRLPDLNYKVLDCQHTSIRELPALSNCERLNCSFCTALTQIRGLENCRWLECTHCVALIQIQGLERCHSLACSFCTSLSQLPALSRCLDLNYLGCSLLSESNIPERLRVNFQAPLYNYSGVYEVKVDELRQNPMKILLELSKPLLQGQGIPKIKFIEQDGREAGGIDAGGLRRILISRLMQELAAHSQEQGQLSFEKEDLGLLPVLKPDSGAVEDQIKGFRTIGALFAHCLRSDDVTGNVFDPSLFRMLTCCSFEDLLEVDLNATEISDELRLKLLATDPNHKITAMLQKSFQDLTEEELENLAEIGTLVRIFEEPGAPNPEQIPLPVETEQWIHARLQREFVDSSKQDAPHKIATILQKSPQDLTDKDVGILIQRGNHTLIFEEPGAPDLKQNPLSLETKQWIHATLKHEVLDSSKHDDTLLPAVMIAKQIQALDGTIEQWDNWRLLATRMQEKIEGVVSKESLLAAIDWQQSHGGVDAAKYNKTKTEYVEHWIKGAELKDLKNLVFVLTGSTALPVGKKVEFRLYDSGNPDRFPTVHTCSFQIDVPINYPTFEIFKEKWDAMIAQSINPEHSGVEEG